MKSEKYISNFSLKLYNLCQRIPVLRKFKVILYFFDSILLMFIRKPKYTYSKKKKIFVIYNYAFGDGVIWLSAANKLRKIYPVDKFQITLICQKGLQSLYENENIFDEVIAYDLTASTFNPKVRFNLFKQLRKQSYDIVLDPIGVAECTTNVFMTRALQAKEKITLLDTTLNEKLCPKWLYTHIYTKIYEIEESGLSLLEYYGKFMSFLGHENFAIELTGLKDANCSVDLPDAYFIVFPSASTELKKWPVERYVELTKRIYETTKLPLLICGTKADKDSMDKYTSLLHEIPYFNVLGKTSLLEFIQVVKRAKLVITNDTSTYHIAAMNQTPVAIITGGYTYDRYVSYKFDNMDQFRKPCIIVHNMNCFNCDNKCKYLKSQDKIWPCLEKVSTEYAWTKLKDLIIENDLEASK